MQSVHDTRIICFLLVAIFKHSKQQNIMRKVTEQTCSAFIQGKKRTVGNTHTDGTTLFLHGNAIAQWRGNDLWITNAGWPTVTTKERLNGLPDVCINQEKGFWYLNGHKWDGGWVQAADFIGNMSESNEKAQKDLVKKINAYVRLFKSPFPMPSGGDCWICMGIVRHGDVQHLLDHIDDQYVHGTIIVNAMREAGYREEGIGLFLNGMGSDDLVQSAVRRYLKRRLTKLAS